MKKLSLSSSSKRYPALMVTDQVLYLAMVNGKGDKFSVFKEIAVPAGLLVNGDVADIAQYTTFVSNVFKQSGLKEKHIIVGLPELKATTQSISLAKMSPEEMTSAVMDHAQSILPFSVSDAYIDWRYEKQQDDDKSVVTISAMPKGVIDRHIQAITAAGLLPVAFETSATTLSRLLPSTAKNLSVCIEYSNTHAVIIILNGESIEASSVIQGSDMMVEKLFKLINYYLHQDEADGKDIDGIYLTGKYITQDFVNQIKATYKKDPVLLGAHISNIANERQVELAILGSLARKQVGLPDDVSTINLLSPDTITMLKQEKVSTTEQIVKCAVLVVLIALVALSAYSLYRLGAKTTALAQEVESLTDEQGLTVKFDAAKIALVTATAEENSRLLGYTDIVISQIPPGITVTGMVYDRELQTLTVSGRAQNRDALLSYRDRLQDSELIEEVAIPLSSLEQQTDIFFRIPISL